MALADLLDSQNAEVLWLLDLKAHVATAADISFSGTTITSAALADFADLPALSHIVVSGSSSNDGTLTVSASTALTVTTVESLSAESAGATVTIYTMRYRATSTFISGSGDSIDANRLYEGRMVDGPVFDRSWFSEDNLGGSSAADLGRIEWLNLDDADGDLVEHERTVDGLDQVIRIGQRGDDLGTDMGSYTVSGESLDPSADGSTLVASLKGKEGRAFRPAQENRYWGLGTCIECDGSTATHKVTVADNSTLRPQLSGADGWIYVSAVAATDAIGAGQVLVQKGTSTTAADLEYELRIKSDGTVRFILVEDDGGTGTARTAIGATVLSTGTKYRLDGVWNSDDDELRVYVNGVLDGTTSWTGSPFTSRTNGIVFGQDGAGLSILDGKLDDIRIGAGTTVADCPTAADIQKWAMRELDLGNPPDYVNGGYWRLNEATGTSAADEINTNTGTLGTSAIWSTLYEGDPDQQGLPKPLAVGRCIVAPTLIDEKNLRYQVHDSQVHGIGPLSEGGNRLTSGLTFTSDQLSFSGSTMTITAAAQIDFEGILAAQEFTVSGSTSNDNGGSTYTVASKPGVVARTVKVSGSFTTEAAGASITITFTATAGGAADYTPDLDTGTFTLASAPTYPLICWVRGDVGSGYVNTPADVWQRLLETYGGFATSEIDTTSVSTLNSATSGYYGGIATQGEDADLSELLDRCAASVGGSWGANLSTGKFEIVQRTAPSGASDLDLTTREIFELQRVRAIPAITAKAVQLLQNPHGGFTEEQIAGSVLGIANEGWYGFLTSPYQRAEAFEDAAVDAKHPTPNPGEDVDSMFADLRSAAVAEAQRLYDMDSQDREIYYVVANLSGHDLDMRTAIVQVTDSDFATLASGKKFRPIRIRTDGTSDEVEMWLWG